MNDTVKNELLNAGIDLESAMNRFLNNEDMYFYFLQKFISDNSMDNLKKAIDCGDAANAFEYAHTLKGVCANLSIDSINEILNPMVEVLRKGSLDGVKAEYDKLFPIYSNVLNVIIANCN